jgi:hypothetical protein
VFERRTEQLGPLDDLAALEPPCAVSEAQAQPRPLSAPLNARCNPHFSFVASALAPAAQKRPLASL